MSKNLNSNMEFTIGEKVFVDMEIDKDIFNDSDKFTVVGRKIIEDDIHLYIVEGKNGKQYEVYPSFVYKHLV